MNLAIIQARLNSTRFYGKVLQDICGKMLIDHIVERIRAATHVDKIVLATTESPMDDSLVSHVEARGYCEIFRGSEEDVLDRFYHCALTRKPERLIRVTADDPLKAPELIDFAVSALLADHSLDYCSNTILPTYPEGLDIEVFTMEALARAHRESRLPSEREHVTPYMWKHPNLFKTLNFEHSEDLSSWRWTVDRPDDLAFIRAIYAEFFHGSSVFSYLDVIDFLKRSPAMLEMNRGTIRNEGYVASIRREES